MRTCWPSSSAADGVSAIAGVGSSGAAGSKLIGALAASASGSATENGVAASTHWPATRQSMGPPASVWMRANTRWSTAKLPPAPGSRAVTVVQSQSSIPWGSAPHWTRTGQPVNPAPAARTAPPSVSPSAGVTINVGAVVGAAPPGGCTASIGAASTAATTTALASARCRRPE
jgi:hypothetical protein